MHLHRLRAMDIPLGGTTLAKLCFTSSEKGSSLKGENLLPRGANSFLL